MIDHTTTWANKAVDNELQAIRDMPTHNVNKPGSPFFIHLLKIASIVRAGYVPRHEAETAVRGACSAHNWIPKKEIEYQWRRALERARPRHPKPQRRLPREAAAAKPKTAAAVFNIIEIDLINGRQRVLRPITSAVAKKSEDLAGMFTNYLESGELPTAVTLQHLEYAPGGVLLRLHFRQYSQALADCVLIACQMVGGVVMDDLQTGVFVIWVRTVYSSRARAQG